MKKRTISLALELPISAIFVLWVFGTILGGLIGGVPSVNGSSDMRSLKREADGYNIFERECGTPIISLPPHAPAAR
jgi:hypothetical protein